MFENDDYFQSYEDSGLVEQGNLGKFGRVLGKWLGFCTIFTVLAFSAYHGISATATYRAGSFLGILTGTVGIITVEVILLSLILRWHNRDISGTAQRIAALVAMAGGFILSFLAIITDSRLNAGLELTPELSFYLLWILPASPLFMMAMNHIVEELEPGQLWSVRAAEEERRFKETKFTASMAAANAELQAAKAIWNAQLNAKVSAAKQIAAHYQSDEVQLAIRQSALGSVPALLRHIGVDPSSIPDANKNGHVDTSDIAAFLEGNPDLAARLFGEARRRDEEANAPVVEVFQQATAANDVGLLTNDAPAKPLYRVEVLAGEEWVDVGGYSDPERASAEAMRHMVGFASAARVGQPGNGYIFDMDSEAYCKLLDFHDRA